MSRDERFKELRKVPPIAAVDHRHFLDSEGKDTRLSELPRHLRRKMKAEGKRIGAQYNEILRRMSKGGVGYPADKFLRALAIEYTHRYASSGTMNQPASFNYFEPFCEIRLIEKSSAPYAEPRAEYNHLFSVPDFFDYLTSSDAAEFKTAGLRELPEGAIYHFTQNGSVDEFSYLNSHGREFLISGFSMIRHGASLHWYMIGGQILQDDELKRLGEADFKLDLTQTPEHKRKFIEEAAREHGEKSGAPVLLEGTANAVRTVIAGEFDLITEKHLVRCHMTETENSFALFADDPDIFHFMKGAAKRDEMLASMRSQVSDASVMWDLAEGFFRLQNYFEFRLTVSESVVTASGLPKPRTTKGGRGIGANFKHVASLEVSETKPNLLVSYTPTPFKVETEGYWHRLDRGAYGTDRDGKPVRGKDWIKADVAWRARPNEAETVFIKSTVAAAKVTIEEYAKAAAEAKKDGSGAERGVLYVMRCVAMSDEIYKVGWTSKTADERARELSTTGIPVPFEVVNSWKHQDPAALEVSVHALLDPYRVQGNREFFRIPYARLKELIEQELKRRG